jgi:L-asparaginase
VTEVMAGPIRPVRVIGVGGTIAMRGERAVPAVDAAELVAEVPQLARFTELRAETALGIPGTHLRLDQALEVARRARAAAEEGEGIVITTGTDTLEELAMLCALTYGGEAPVVITGANRPGSSPGADGPANLLDAVAVAASAKAAGLGVVVVFGGEIHVATAVRKVDSTGPAAFGSPVTGPIGRVVEQRVWLGSRPVRHPPIPVNQLEHRVPIVTVGLGDAGESLAVLGPDCDGLVLVALGAGHVSAGVLAGLRAVLQRVPVLITCRPERGSMLFDTYGFEGAERDLRDSGAVCAPFLSPQAARIALLCCLGAGLDRDAIARALARFDAG